MAVGVISFKTFNTCMILV